MNQPGRKESNYMFLCMHHQLLKKMSTSACEFQFRIKDELSKKRKLWFLQININICRPATPLFTKNLCKQYWEYKWILRNGNKYILHGEIYLPVGTDLRDVQKITVEKLTSAWANQWWYLFWESLGGGTIVKPLVQQSHTTWNSNYCSNVLRIMNVVYILLMLNNMH